MSAALQKPVGIVLTLAQMVDLQMAISSRKDRLKEAARQCHELKVPTGWTSDDPKHWEGEIARLDVILVAIQAAIHRKSVRA